jgi:hypothetical protein
MNLNWLREMAGLPVTEDSLDSIKWDHKSETMKWVKLSTFEQAKKISKGTRWDIAEQRHFDHYHQHGLFFVVLTGGGPRIRLLASGTDKQFFDENDRRASKDVVDRLKADAGYAKLEAAMKESGDNYKPPAKSSGSGDGWGTGFFNEK